MGEKDGIGSSLFSFYRNIIGLRRRVDALRSRHIQVLHTHNDNRVIAFKRWGNQSEALVLASLSNYPYSSGYTIHHDHLPDAAWREVFSSDATEYGGIGYGNCGATLHSHGGWFHAVIPANGFVVFERE